MKVEFIQKDTTTVIENVAVGQLFQFGNKRYIKSNYNYEYKQGTTKTQAYCLDDCCPVFFLDGTRVILLEKAVEGDKIVESKPRKQRIDDMPVGTVFKNRDNVLYVKLGHDSRCPGPVGRQVFCANRNYNTYFDCNEEFEVVDAKVVVC